jgi:hypothetical protein
VLRQALHEEDVVAIGSDAMSNALHPVPVEGRAALMQVAVFQQVGNATPRNASA